MSKVADTPASEPRTGRVRAARMPRVAVIGSPTRTTDLLVGAWLAAGVEASAVTPALALATLEAGDVALFRLDVLPTLDGVEPGFDVLPDLEDRGVRVLNRPDALLAAHDKLRTAAVLSAAGLRQPLTFHVTTEWRPAHLPFPCVVKPRFGSWGKDVVLCKTRGDLDRAFAAVSSRPWWRRHGALVQELIPSVGKDLRLLSAGGEIVGGAVRVAASGEWRTNISMGGRLESADPPPEAVVEAERAAGALAIDLAGVDLLPWDSGWVVLELNGAVDFDERYSLRGRDLYGEIARALALTRTPQRKSAYAPMAAPEAAGTMGSTPRKETIMVKTIQGLPAEVGDLIQITGHVVGDAPRNAEILEVLGDPGHEHYRVSWEDGHESIYFPADDAVITRPKAGRRRTPRT
jgi:RimK family alpha-L-glutamate ligase